MGKLIMGLYGDEKGQGLVEYSLIISVIVLGALVAVETFGDGVKDYYTRIRDEVASLMD